MMFLNVVVVNGFIRKQDIDSLFPPEEELFFCSPLTSLQDLLVKLGAFESKSQARKIFKVKTMPDGWSHFTIGKMRRELCIWNPTE